jgi:RNA polymerase sigma-70 factor (ECF subfamily)
VSSEDAYSALDDAQLMARLAEGDGAALTALVRRYQRHVLETAYRLTGDRTLAEDVGQETFVRVWRSARRYEPTARFSTWLYRIVLNLCIDASRKRGSLSFAPSELSEERSAPASDPIERNEQVAVVRRAVAALPERQRIALVMHRFSGLSCREIVEATGWSSSSVESLLVRAYASLRQTLMDIAL